VLGGCKKCAFFYAGRTDECMSCGGACSKKVCEGGKYSLECAKTEKYRTCHKACMKDEKEEVAKEEAEQEHVPEKKEEQKEVDKKDCYFDEECHKLVDWEMVTRVKMGFFERSRKMQDKSELRPMAEGLRARLIRAGVPEDRVDYIVNKWVTAAAEKMPTPDSEVCSKYEKLGELAVSGCAKCGKYYPGRTQDCMDCGARCSRKVCEKDGNEECYKSEAFVECHKGCMAKDAAESPCYGKLMKLKRGVAKMFQFFTAGFNEVGF
jgi:hypothetical protein